MRPLITLLLTLLQLTALAQQGTGVRGRVTDEGGAPVPYANVAVLALPDSGLVTGGITNEEGRFRVPVDPGSYAVKVSFLGFTEKRLAATVQQGFTDLGTVVLRPGGIAMDEVEVVGERRQMELQLDKRVFNVDKDMSVRGGTAADVLDNVPSVSVDVEGNVSLRGSQNVRILIDGKPSGLVGISSTDALRMLQGDLIDKVEVITNPSARYDAEGEVGIINIVLKKQQRNGLNGSFEVTTGYPDNHGISFSLNHRSRHVNLFSSYGFAYRRAPGQGSSFQESTGDTTFRYEREREHTRGGRSHNLQLGADIFLTPKQTLTLSGLYRDGLSNNDALLIYRDLDGAGTITRTTNRTEDEEETDLTRELALSYRKDFPQKDRRFTADVKWMDNDDIELSTLTEVSDPGSTLDQRSSNTENERNILLQWDYVHPFHKDGRFEMGMRSTLRDIENDYLVEQLDPDGDWMAVEGFDEFFTYKEHIHAGYVMAGDKHGRFSYQAGLRAEYTDLATELVESGITNPRSYLDLFPSAHLSHEIDSLSTIQLSYSRRINRPRFRNLLPFFTFSDNRVFFSGNPDLNPEYTHSVELGYMRYFQGGSALTSLYYRHGTGVVERITVVDSTGITRIFPVNLSTRDAVGVELNVNWDVTDWWRLTANVNANREVTEGRYEDQLLTSDTYTWSVQGISKFTVKKAWDLQLNGNYRGPQRTTQGRSLAITSMDLAVGRDVLKGRGTITFSVRDVFNSRIRRSIVDVPDFYSESEFQWRVRQFILTFNYRLRPGKSRRDERGRGEGGGMDGGGDMF